MSAQEEWIRHLEELRRRLIVVGACFVTAFCGGMYASPHLLKLIRSHAGTDVQWNVFAYTDGLFVYLRCATLFALVLVLPVVLFQLWAFVKPGLTDREAKGTLMYVPASFLLFLTGLAFSYWVVFPMMLDFMQKMNRTVGAVETYGIDRYFSFLFSVVFPLALAFEMPLVILFLTRIGMLTPARLKQTRKYAYLGLAVVGSCISPPDFVSHLSVTIPLVVLYEISAFLSVRLYNRRAQPVASP
ncbi:twin-arginine translocase subunit TatC [Paenibacillus sp. D51F]